LPHGVLRYSEGIPFSVNWLDGDGPNLGLGSRQKGIGIHLRNTKNTKREEKLTLIIVN